MYLILFVITILFVGVAIYFWKLGSSKMEQSVVETFLSPQPTARFWRFEDHIIRSSGFGIDLTPDDVRWSIFNTVVQEMLKEGQSSINPLLLNALANMKEIEHRGARPVIDETTKEMGVGYSGRVTLPRKIYEGNSCNLTAKLYPTAWLGDSTDDFSEKHSIDVTPIQVQIQRNRNLQQFLEIELQAAGITVDGDKKQRQPLTSSFLSYYWNCYFENSGEYSFRLILRLINPDDTLDIGIIEVRRIKVVKLDHLTQRQVWIIGTFAGIVSGGLAIAEALHALGVW